MIDRVWSVGLLVGSLSLLSACGEVRRDDSPLDGGIDEGSLVNGRAAIWVDPDGCQHWYIDDGIEGYMTPRLNRDGTPRCRGGAYDAKGGSTAYIEPEPVL